MRGNEVFVIQDHPLGEFNETIFMDVFVTAAFQLFPFVENKTHTAFYFLLL